MLLMKDVAGNLFFPSLNINNIYNWDYEQSYKVYMVEANEITIEGIKIRPEEVILSLSNSWNWIPYLKDEQMPVVTAMEDIVDDMLLIKDNSGNMYFPSLNINSLSVLQMGKGYMLYMYSANELVYPENESYPRSALALGNKELYTAKYLQSDIFKTGSDAALIISLDAADETEIAVYDRRDNLIGSGKVSDNLTYITIWGDDSQTEIKDGAEENELLKLKLYDPDESSYLDLELTHIEEVTTGLNPKQLFYRANAVYLADVENKSNEIQSSSVSINPNPCKDVVNIDYSLESASSVVIEIYNINGEKMYVSDIGSQSAGIHNHSISLTDYNNGVYQLVIRTNDAFMTEKLIILK